MSVTRVYLARHGQTSNHHTKCYNGQNDIDLTAIGHKQSQRLTQRLATVPLHAVYSSDLQRCRIAAEQIAACHNLSPKLDARLRERHVGRWQGRPWQEIAATEPDLWQAYVDDIAQQSPPGGESLHQVAARLLPAWQAIIANHPGQTLAIVAHGGINRVLLLHILGAPLQSAFNLEQKFACLNLIEVYADGHSVIQYINT